jgi:2-dehydropantoate 2-reductase
MRVFLFGTGAMSSLFAARLAGAADVTLLGTWAEAIDAIRRRGILLEDSSGSRTIQVKADYIGAELDPADLAIILVKSWQTEQVAKHLSRYLSLEGIAVTLQNGFGNLELLGKKAFPGSTAEGATLIGPGHVRAGGSGPTHMVAPEWTIELFRSAGFECHGCRPDEAEGLLWGKLVISCGINALTALLGVPNGELLKTPSAADLMICAAEECAAVAHARGVRLPFPDPAARVKEVAEKTATNLSSMLQDVRRGARTECDAINGAIVAEGRRLGIPTPVNNSLWRLVQAAVHHNRSVLRQCGL